MNILSFRDGHNASATLYQDGQIIADIAEERLSRSKNDASFPFHSIKYCLDMGGIHMEDIDIIALPSHDYPDFISHYFDVPDEVNVIQHSPESSIKRDLLNSMKRKKGKAKRAPFPAYINQYRLSPTCEIHLVNHHLAHAASACFTSGSTEPALVITMDGRGDQVSSAVWWFDGRQIQMKKSYGQDSSLGYFYSCATEALMWMQSCDEWKVMGLAPYGKPQPGQLEGLHPEFENGQLSKGLNFPTMHRFKEHGIVHYHCEHSKKLQPFVKNMGRENFAAEVQRVTEEQAMNFIKPLLEQYNTRRLYCSGGFFLNVKLNQKLWETGLLDHQWVYPEPGDAGLTMGATLYAANIKEEPRQISLETVYYGPEFSNEEIQLILDDRGLNYEFAENVEEITASLLMDNHVLGWFQNKLESGPRALGNRSIIMSPLRAENKDILNGKIKFREAFRPFCPSILYESASSYFENYRDEFFMTSAFKVREEKRTKIPAVVHVDGTARPQLVKKENNPRYHTLIEEFGKLSGEDVIVNTSFNIKGEPIVCHPREAIRCFMDTGMDVLVLGNFILKKPHLK
ncbi:MAG: hypothetical protein HQL32_10915 [Planctomycetes bacterium]|nr:hypothetical protein [Planctomycetota bacterium]